ncbi:DNA cytosine methyltransferase [Streptomyces exfoliatus]|uniref:DNA cytosine methyltransferase n=1 Tax=Streptomyces exfoliatus TaxID=1905 RepID=UPI003794E771
MSGLRIGSLCTGYGGLDMAVQAVIGGTLSWVADNDPGAARILAHHHPDVPNLGDITAVDWRALEPVDVLVGGYPCQPFSSAGKRKGTADARHIWPHIARALGVLRPRYAVFENVAGHLSLGFDAVLADLAALGFDAEWRTLRASDIGAAHQRNRLFLLAWPADPGSAGLAGRRAEGATAHGRHLASADPLDVGEHRSGARGAGRDEPAARRLPAADTSGRGLQGRPPVDRPEPSQQFSDADGPDFQRGVAADSPRVSERESADQADPLAGSGHARPLPGGGGLRTGHDADAWGPYGPAIARWEAVLGRPGPGPVDALGRLNPPLVEWLMGLPAGHVTDVPGLSRSAQLKALGNGVVPQQATAALRDLLARAEATTATPSLAA